MSENKFAPYTTPRKVIDTIRLNISGDLPRFMSVRALSTYESAKGLETRIQQAFKFLGLIDENTNQTPLFHEFTDAPIERYKELLSHTLRAAYSHVFSKINPSEATDEQLMEAFRYYQPEKQLRGMTALFFALCQEAGIIPADRKLGRAPRTSSRMSDKSSSNGYKPKGQTALQLTSLEAKPDDSPSVDYRLLEDTLRHVPKNGRWSSAQRKKWLDAVQANADLLIEVEDVPKNLRETETNELAPTSLLHN